MARALDPVELTRRLVRRRSVTPADDGALDVLEEALAGLGFACHRLPFGEVDNLYARLGEAAPNLCFAGHTDVVPPGDEAAWRAPPFAGEVVDGELVGRGVVDMKGAIGCYAAALSELLAAGPPAGSLSVLITGDEEGPAIDGTRRVLDWLAARGEALDACIVGEPTSGERLGDTVKVGRRGSLSARLTVRGVQGHTAYPQHADNPLHRLVGMLAALIAEPLDAGSAHFEPSSLQLTTVDVGNPATNVIPAAATAALNVRFNDLHTGAEVERWLHERLAAADGAYELEPEAAAESFLCPPGALAETLQAAVEAEIGIRPAFGTGGGTSDARFIKDACPVAELGLRNATAHQVDERAPVADLRRLTAVYRAAVAAYLAG